MTITLGTITDENIRECLALDAGNGKENFVSNSFAIAWLHRNSAEPLIIYNNDIAVGFLLLLRDTKQECHISRIMIDKNHQRKGYAADAIRTTIAYIKQKMPDVSTLTLSVSPKNTAAIRLYEKLGFVSDGTLLFDEIVYRWDMNLTKEVKNGH